MYGRIGVAVSSAEFSRRFLGFVRAFQERNQFIVRAYKTDLLPVESHILTEIDTHGKLTGSELADYLNISPARLSLLLKNLKKRKLVQLIPNKEESLRKPYGLTANGKRLLKELDQQADEQLERMTCVFSAREIGELSDFFRLFSDGVGAPLSSARSAEHPLRFVARRLTRWLGQLGNNFFESGVSPLEWHILHAIHDDDGKAISSGLAERFNTSKQLISKSLKRLERKKLISGKAGIKDRRQRHFRLTAKGENVIAALEKRASAAAVRVLGKIPERKKGVRIFNNAYALVGLPHTNKEFHVSVLRTVHDALRAYDRLAAQITDFDLSEVGDVSRKKLKSTATVSGIAVFNSVFRDGLCILEFPDREQKKIYELFLMVFHSTAQKTHARNILSSSRGPYSVKALVILDSKAAELQSFSTAIRSVSHLP